MNHLLILAGIGLLLIPASCIFVFFMDSEGEDYWKHVAIIWAIAFTAAIGGVLLAVGTE